MNLLHKEYILPLLERWRPRTILEIGVREGWHTFLLLNWCQDNDCKLTSIDPTPWIGSIPEEIKPGGNGFVYKREKQSESEFVRPSYVEKIYQQGLQIYWDCIKKLSLSYLGNCLKDFDFVLVDGDHNYHTVYNELLLIRDILTENGIILLHDVSNPSCKRQDYYYDYQTIPEEARYSDKQGILTAIEDFLCQNPNYGYFEVTQEFNGLGVISRRKSA